MSNLETTPEGRDDGLGNVFQWSDKSTVRSNEIMVRLNWKTTKNGSVGHDARYVAAPVLQFSFDCGPWSEFFLDAVQEYQRSLIHAYVTEQLNNGNKSPVVPKEYFDAEGILAAWTDEQENSGKGRGRISAEQITEFFNYNLRDPLMLRLAQKKGFTDENQPSDKELKELEQSVNQYRALFAKLSAGTLQGNVQVLNLAKAALDLVPNGDIVKNRIARRIETLSKISEITLEVL